MPTKLTTDAIEEGTYVITAAFTDEDGDAVTPNAGLVWSLTDGQGNVINSRENVAITPATSVTIVLTGDDLAIGTNKTHRVLLVEGTYDSTLGSNLPLKDQATFDICDLVKVT